MSRNSSGVYSLPEPPFVPGTPISSTSTNSNNSDIGDALTDSLSRTGLGAMQAVLSLATAGLSYAADPDSGLRRSAANTQALSVGGSDYTFTEDDVTTPTGTSLLPLIGEVRMYALPTAPTGWIFMRGQACTTTYPLWRAALIAAGNPYGTSGGDPLFPNMQCVVPAGFDATGRGLLTGSTTLGALVGAQTVTLAISEMPAHDHPGSNAGVESAPHTHGFTFSGASYDNAGITAAVSGITGTGLTFGVTTTTESATHTHTIGIGSQGGGGAHANVQPTIILNFIGRAA